MGKITIIPRLCKLMLKEKCDLPREYREEVYGRFKPAVPLDPPVRDEGPLWLLPGESKKGPRGRAVGLLRPKTPEGITKNQFGFLQDLIFLSLFMMRGQEKGLPHSTALSANMWLW